MGQRRTERIRRTSCKGVEDETFGQSLTLHMHLCETAVLTDPGGGGGVLPYMGYIGMCGAKGYGFSAVLVINRVSLLAILPPFW